MILFGKETAAPRDFRQEGQSHPNGGERLVTEFINSVNIILFETLRQMGFPG
jgi:hypothetical protein